MTYHRWLLFKEKEAKRGVPGASISTDDLLDDMMERFKDVDREFLKEIIGAWDGTPESIGEKY